MPEALSRTRHGRPVFAIASRSAASVTTFASTSFSITSHQSSVAGARVAVAAGAAGAAGAAATAVTAVVVTATVVAGAFAAGAVFTPTVRAAGIALEGAAGSALDSGAASVVALGEFFMNIAYHTRSSSSARARRRSRCTVRWSGARSSIVSITPLRFTGTTSSSMRRPVL